MHVRLLIVWDPATQAGVKLISMPSKRLGLYTAAASTIIARSDSNGEDLEAFAGAGMLHSSFTCHCYVCTHHAVHCCCALVIFSWVLRLLVYAHVILAERLHSFLSNLVHISAKG